MLIAHMRVPILVARAQGMIIMTRRRRLTMVHVLVSTRTLSKMMAPAVQDTAVHRRATRLMTRRRSSMTDHATVLLRILTGTVRAV